MNVIKNIRNAFRKIFVEQEEELDKQCMVKFRPGYWWCMGLFCTVCLILSWWGWRYWCYNMANEDSVLVKWIVDLQTFTAVLLIGVLFCPFGKLLRKIGLVEVLSQASK